MSRATTPITGRQLQVYEYVVDFIQTQGYPPTVREIAAGLYVSSPSTVQMHLKLLVAKGYLKGAGRTLRLGDRRPRVLGPDGGAGLGGQQRSVRGSARP